MILRLKYSKTPQGRFLSHLDLLRTMQRIFRRAGLPLAYSEGFNPHPKISYGSALAVGVTSDGEYLDVELREELSAPEVAKRIEPVLPPGIRLISVKELEGRQDSLMAIINMARYRVEAHLESAISQSDADEMIATLLEQENVLVTREGKKGLRNIDIRAGLYNVTAQVIEGKLFFLMDLQTGSEGNVRPEEVITWLSSQILKPKGIDIKGNLRIHRIGLFVRDKDRIRTPIED